MLLKGIVTDDRLFPTSPYEDVTTSTPSICLDSSIFIKPQS